MKYLKLALVFVAVCGVIVGAFFLKNPETDIIISKHSNDTYEEFRKQFVSEWEQKGDWDETLYSSHCDMIKQLSKDYDNTEPLNDMNTATAVEIVHKNIFANWKKTNCTKATIDRYIKAVNTIKNTDKNAKSNPLVKEIENVNSTYRAACKYAYCDTDIEPTFDGEKWNSFTKHSDDILRERNRILNNGNYRTYLSNIASIKSGLNGVESRLEKSKKLFYNQLADKIVSYYEEIPDTVRTMAQKNALRNVRNNYENEYMRNNDINAIAQQYAEDVEKNMSDN